MATVAAASGQLELESYLSSEIQLNNSDDVRFGPGVVLQLYRSSFVRAAAASGSIATVQFLYQAGLELTYEAYLGAAEAGRLAMIRWLACEEGVSAEGLDLQSWIDTASLRGGALLEAVQLVVGAGCTAWEVDEEAHAVRGAARRGRAGFVAVPAAADLGVRRDESA